MGFELREFPRWKCHKEVHALKIEALTVGPDQRTIMLVPSDSRYAPIEVGKAYLDKHQPVPPGYYVIYADGYASWTPVAAFEEGYSLTDIASPQPLQPGPVDEPEPYVPGPESGVAGAPIPGTNHPEKPDGDPPQGAPV